MHLSTVSAWVTWIESIHCVDIDLGLERVKKVAQRLQVLSPPCPIVIVGGTNGKGSTVAGLESIYLAQGYQTGAFTSPILFKQNEQVRINGNMIDDENLCQAFSDVEAARDNTKLTFFEFCTLAALCIFKKYNLSVWLLEVGLGGRLDAVNILQPDLAIITSIDIDHINWLGDTREKIGYEKAGIFRNKKNAICGDSNPPLSLLDVAKSKQTNLYRQCHDFYYQQTSHATWSWTDNKTHYDHLPMNALALHNMSMVMMAISLLQPQLPVTYHAIESGLKNVHLPARIQVIPGPVMTIIDVAHNPSAVTFLCDYLKNQVCLGKTIAVFSMLEDKDMIQSILAIKEQIYAWYVAPLKTKRGANKEKLLSAFTQIKITDVNFFSSVSEAYQAAMIKASLGDRVVIFGSFHTITEAVTHL